MGRTCRQETEQSAAFLFERCPIVIRQKAERQNPERCGAPLLHDLPGGLHESVHQHRRDDAVLGHEPAPLVVARPSAAQLLPADQLRLLQTGKVEERRKVLTALAPDVRAQVLSTVAPPVLVDLPDFQAEAAKARAAEAQARRSR